MEEKEEDLFTKETSCYEYEEKQIRRFVEQLKAQSR